MSRSSSPSSRLHRLDLLPQETPRHADAAIAGRQMFFRMQADGALADLCLPIAGKALVLFLAHLRPDFTGEAFPPLGTEFEILGHLHDMKDGEVLIIDGHAKTDGGARPRRQFHRRHDAHMGE